MTTPADILRAAAGYAAKGRCCAHEARTADFEPVPYDSPAAVAWDCVGAIAKAADELGADAVAAGLNNVATTWLAEPSYHAFAALWAAIVDTSVRNAENYSGSELIDLIAGWDSKLDRTLDDIAAAFARAAVLAAERNDDVQRRTEVELLRAQRDDARRAS